MPATYLWVAERTDGSIVAETPGLSSDSLPRDDVVAMSYRPADGNPQLPTIRCEIDLKAGDRFVRYWAQSMAVCGPRGGIVRRRYVVGWEPVSGPPGAASLLFWYPEEQRVVFSANRASAPPQQPSTLALLPPTALLLGGPSAGYLGWQLDGRSAYLIRVPGGLLFRNSLTR